MGRVITILNQKESSTSSESSQEIWLQELEEAVKAFLEAGDEWLESQPGMEKFKTDENLLNDPSNQNYYECYNDFENSTLGIFDHRNDAEEYLTQTVAAVNAKLLAAVDEMSSRISI